MEAGRAAHDVRIRWRTPKLVMRRLDDRRLVELVRAGHEEAFEVVYDRHAPSLLSFCTHMLRSRAEAEEVVQQTLLAAHARLAGDSRRLELRPWLYTVARNRSLSILRARRDAPGVPELDIAASESLLRQVEAREELRGLLLDVANLPEQQRAALLMAQLDDLSHAEIASVLDCGEMKVKSLVFQARTALVEARAGREMDCQAIRERLAAGTGGALRAGDLKAGHGSAQRAEPALSW